MLLAKCPLLPVMRLAAMDVIRHNINRLERRLFAECTSWERIVPRFSGRKESLERVSCFGQDTDSLIGWVERAGLAPNSDSMLVPALRQVTSGNKRDRWQCMLRIFLFGADEGG